MEKEIILIEKKVFEKLIEKIELLSIKVTFMHKRDINKRLNEYLDAEQVCNILNIKPRTLQTYRDTGRIEFTQIAHKIYYRVSDVERFLKSNMINNK